MGRKRKSSSLIPNHKGRVPPCRICEAPGTGFHYGVNTCEACKGFFHRSLEQHMHYRCEKDNNCVIHFTAVKFCQKCRYVKCLAFGMSKTASKTGRYPSCKRTQDILELKQLEKQHTNSVTCDTDLNTKHQTTSDAEGSPVKQPCSRPKTDLEAVLDSTHLSIHHATSGVINSNSIPSPSSNFSPQSDCSALCSSSTTSSPINLSLTSYESIPGTPTSTPSSLTSITNECRSPVDILAASEISSFRSSYQVPPQKGSKTLMKTDSTRCPDSTSYCPCASSSPSLSPSPHNSNNYNNDNDSSSTAFIPSCPPHSVGSHDTFTAHPPSCSMCLENQSSSTSFPWSHTPLPECSHQVQGIPQKELSTRLGSELGELTDFLLVSTSSQDTEVKVELPNLDAPTAVDESTAKIMKKLDKIYADYESVVKTLLEVEGQTLRHKARDMSPTEILTAQLKHKQACLTRTEMFGRKIYLEESEYENVRRETGLDVDGRQDIVAKKFKSIEKLIMALAVFAKAIPGFRYIPLHQMVRLIKYARWDISFISSLSLTNSNLMVSMTRSCGWTCPLDFDEKSSKAFVIPSIRRLGRVQKENLTDEELAVICGIVIVAPDRTEPTDSPLIRHIHSHLINILLKLLHHNHKQPMQVFALIVSLLTEGRTLEVKASENYLKDMRSVIVKELAERPIVQEMMTGICFEPE